MKRNKRTVVSRVTTAPDDHPTSITITLPSREIVQIKLPLGRQDLNTVIIVGPAGTAIDWSIRE